MATDRLTQAARRRMLELERRERARVDQAALTERLDETARLAEARGEEMDKPKQGRGEGRKPMRRMSGLEWLHRKGRITPDQMAAGVRYGAAYRRSALSASIRSILNRDVTGSEGPTLAQIQAHAEGTARARLRLAMYRNQLMGETTIINACDLICGDEKTPREAAQNGRDASAYEALLIAGLGLLLLHMAPVPAEIADRPQDVVRAA